MSNFLLVHGSWMNSACWAETIDQLAEYGHGAVAIDLPGHGDLDTPLSEISLDAYIGAVVAGAEEIGAPVRLVGHSMAGCVISAVAEARPDLIEELVYVAAYLPASGQSLNDLAQSDADSGVGPAMRPAPDWSTLDLAEESRADLFFHDVPPSVSESFLAMWNSEPVAPLTVPITLTEKNFGSIPRRYICTTLDRVVSPQLQARMVAATPTPMVEMATGHLPMLVDPEGFARLLVG